MRKVHKLKIDLLVHDYKLPRDSIIVQFCEDGHGDLCIWYVFTDPTVKYDDRNLRVYGTGQDVPMNTIYVATAMCGPFVWHLFEVSPMVNSS